MPPPRSRRWSRRAFLAGTGAGVIALAAAARANSAPRTLQAPDDEYAVLRGRWLELALGAGYDAASEPYASRLAATGALAAQFRASMAPADNSLWTDYPFDPPSGITQSYSRLWTMTQAFLQDGTGLTGDTALLADIISGTDHLSARIYRPATTPYGNWWEWQIGSPRLLMDLVTALHDQLSEARIQDACAAVDHFIPDAVLADYSGTSTGANRVDLCRSVAMRGVNGRAPEKIALARDALSPVYPYVTGGDGLYPDGSFIQHSTISYSGTYGQVMLDGLGRLFTLLDGSTWAVTDPGRQVILDSVEHAYAPVIYNGLAMDSVNGRAISRGYLKGDDQHVMRSDHFHGKALIAAMAVIAGGASDAERLRWQAMIKGWIERDTTTPILTSPQFGVGDLSRLQAVAEAPAPAAPEPVAHHLFASMDRAVHRRRDWAANISMCSERISYYECGNGENPHGWHTGAGMLCWWPAEKANDQYTDWFWPTVDPYRLPGTTVSTKRLADRAGGEWGAAKPAVQWVGGSSDGEFAAVGQHVKGLTSTLEARKSWFCAADTVICLGAGITATDGVPVETVVDNRNLGADGTGEFTVDGRRHPHWAHLEGHGGWVFPGGTGALRTLREARTGSWSDINSTSTTEQRTRIYRTLWLDHGTDPADASYAYLLMPGASRRALTARAADRGWLEVLRNTAEQQAVTVRSLGLTAVNFWQAGTVGPVSVTSPASVLMRGNGRRATLHISEPPRTGQPVEIVLDRPVHRVTSADSSVQVLSTGRTLRLRVTPGTAGATHGCEVILS
ncbi:polysaccharide lyase 8 family protein [Streptomyces sp. NBC_00344]|uniref:polysaccharide lyase 8 family protein n=1 Tax=Streptomyces sp. NBC_00344 TaxID=2975720 RepID=UPI003FA7E902